MYSVILLSLLKTVFAETCNRNDLLIDDFSTAQRAIVDGADRQVNKLGGDYGSLGATFSVDVNTKSMKTK